MKKFLFLSLAGLLAAGVWSCNKDMASNEAKPFETDQTFFANINIGNVDAMTRGGDLSDTYGPEGYKPDEDPNFSKGTPAESQIKSVYLVFYDADGNRVATTQVRKDNDNMDNDYNVSDYGENNGQSIFKGVVQIDIKHGSYEPAYVMCFINPITAQNFDINPSFATLDELQKTTRPRIIDKNDNFAMSKSVYYGPNRAKEGYNSTWDNDPTKYEKIIATPIASSSLFKSKDAAKKAMEDYEKADDKSGLVNPVLDIYVERYAVKVNFSIAEAGYDNSVKIENKTLTFVPEYWAVNAYESDTYICKSFLDKALSKDMDYKTMNDALGGDKAWFWNNPARHRSYWAQSPAYYKEAYPRVADDIKDKQASFGFAGGYALGYYSYNEIVENAHDNKNWTDLTRKARDLQDDADKDRPIYARENTISGAALKAANGDPMASPKAAIASIALVGHYEIQDEEIENDKTFYVMGNATNGYRFFTDDNDQMLTYLVNTTVPFYMDAQGHNTFFDYGIDQYGFTNKEYISLFNIEHPSLMVRAYGSDDEEKSLVIDSRFVTVQLDLEKVKEFKNADKYIYAYIDGKYTQVTENNIDMINQQMLYAAGTVQCFQGGKAYFTIPIKHLGFYRDGNANANKNANDKTFNWSEVQSGDFGLVRNHIYTITVDNIIGLGNAIPDPNDPIVPPTDPEEYFIGARIIVLNWAVVPAQHETL